MKKLLILFVAVFALSFVAESAFAQGLLSGRLRQNSNSDVAAVQNFRETKLRYIAARSVTDTGRSVGFVRTAFARYRTVITSS